MIEQIQDNIVTVLDGEEQKRFADVFEWNIVTS